MLGLDPVVSEKLDKGLFEIFGKVGFSAMLWPNT